MLANNPKTDTKVASDQAVLSLINAVGEQARHFYQQAISSVGDVNIRRHFAELLMLHRQAEKLVATGSPKLANDNEITTLYNWYRGQSSAMLAGKNSWRAELPEQLRRQLAAFKRLNRDLVQRENIRALANLTASIQIVADQLTPLLKNSNQ